MEKLKNHTSRKIRLCFIGDASNVHTHRHVNHFVDLGHEVHLVDDHHYQYKNLNFHLVKNYTGIRFIDYFLRILQSIAIIKKIKPDVVHSFQVTYHGFIGALSGKHPFMLTPWGSDILFVPDYNPYYKHITKFTIFRSDVIHCIDVSVIARLRQMYGNKINKKDIFVLNEGINAKFFAPVQREGRAYQTILCLRALKDSYNPLLLIEALNLIVNKRKYQKLKVIMLKTGDENYRQKLLGKIKEYGLSKYIKLYDWVNNKTADYMKEADIYVDTIYRPTHGQGTGKTMLEALSSGLAIAAPDNPSMDIYIKNNENGVLYKGNNADSLADSILALIKNKPLRLKLMKNARQFALKNFNLENNMKVMENKYFGMLN